MTATTPSELLDRLRSVTAPAPVMSRERERELTDRQREILDELGEIFDKGFADLTMADLAAQLNCSLRTLYGLAPSRDELVLTVVDRNLWRIGRSATAAIEPEMQPLDAIRAYLSAATVAVSDTTEDFARDINATTRGRDLNDAHSGYLVEVTTCLLDLAVDRGDIGPVDSAAVARVIAGVGRDFSRPEVLATLRSTPKQAADTMVDIVLTGLKAA